MREYKVNATNAPSRYVLIAAESALEAERLATRDGYAVFGVTLPWPGSDDRDEFEGMTPRELRNLIRSLQDDLRRAVIDRGKLLTFVNVVYNEASDGMTQTTKRHHTNGGLVVEHTDGHDVFAYLCDEAAKVKTQVEGK